MIKTLILTFLTGWTTVFFPQNYDVKQLRNLLNQGNQDEKAANELYQKIGEYAGEDALLLGYQASALALRAKYNANPFKKLNAIKASSRIFDRAVGKAENNLELRFMRYAVEVNTPEMLDLSKHLDQDKAILLAALRSYPNAELTPETARIARDFMQQYCKCSEEEKAILKAVKLQN